MTRPTRMTTLMFEHTLIERPRADRKRIVLPKAGTTGCCNPCGTVPRCGWRAPSGHSRRRWPGRDISRRSTGTAATPYSDLTSWFEREVAADWEEHRAWASRLLQREAQLLEVVQLVGADTLAPPERVLLRTGRLLREDSLQQSAFDERDAYCDPPKQVAMLRAIRAADAAMRGGGGSWRAGRGRRGRASVTALAQMRFWAAAEAEQRATTLVQRLETELGNLG